MENNIPDAITVFTSHDADRFLQQYQEKTNSFESFFLKNNPSSLISNLKTQTIVLAKGQQTLFATLNNKEYNNPHICSPYNTYIGYAKTSAKNFNSVWIRILIHAFTTLFGNLFKLLRLNKVIQLNNTLSTINLHPENIGAWLPEVVQTLIKRYPQHAIIWPRFNERLDANLYNILQTTHFVLIPTKLVHIYDSNKNYMKRSNTKHDLSLLKNSDYTVVFHHELTEKDIDRIHVLYEMLFIKKHSAHNLNLTLQYFKSCHRYRWFEFSALRNKNGIIDAFTSYAKRNNVMICGPIGYDTTQPIKRGLYRMIISLSLHHAHKEKCIYNIGSGNELFKLNRGSMRQLEYNAVYYQHLPFYRQIPWKILNLSCNQFSRRVLKNYLL